MLAILQRPDGTTLAQIAEVIGWQAQTVPSSFAGLERRRGTAGEAAERIRQVGPHKQGAKDCYTVCRVT